MRAMTMTLIFCMTASGAFGKPPLRDVTEIDEVIVQVRIADKIRKKCDDISARMLRANSLVFGLKSKARDMGYTDAEIRAYVDSEPEKDRQRALRDAYLVAAGVDLDRAETYCALGKAEIEKGGQIGALLRMK